MLNNQSIKAREGRGCFFQKYLKVCGALQLHSAILILLPLLCKRPEIGSDDRTDWIAQKKAQKWKKEMLNLILIINWILSNKFGMN